MRKFFVAIFGGTLLLLGIAMIVLPGPAVLVIPAGLAVLGTEFLWARRVLHRCKGVAAKARENLRWGSCKGKKKPATSDASAFDGAVSPRRPETGAFGESALPD